MQGIQHIYSTYTCVHSSLLQFAPFVSSRAMSANTFLQGWFSTSTNGDDTFPPATTERQHGETFLPIEKVSLVFQNAKYIYI